MEWRGVVKGLLMGFLVLIMSVEVIHSVEVSTCTTVNKNTVACLTYVRGAEPAPSSSCCKGVKTLDALASSSLQIRRDICSCLQSSAKILKPNPSAVAALSSICGATHPFSLTQNCATIP